MRVVVCGAGMGGLTLAHGLKRYADVLVLDRDQQASATGGYRLHLDAAACQILERVLPASTWSAIRAVSDGPSAFRAFTVADDRLCPVVVDPQPAGEDRLLCHRPVLRELLAEPLGDRVRFGAQVDHVVVGESDARVVLSTGETITADVVVGAEGPASPTVTALAGAPTATPTGLVGIAGSTSLDPSDQLPAHLLAGPGLAVSGSGTGLFLSTAGLNAPPGDMPPEIRDLAPRASLVWGLIARRASLPDMLPTSGEELVELAVEQLSGWEPRLRALVERAQPDTVALYTFRAADPRADLTPWRPGPVTALGDAVHCMPPTGGRAAATAIRDAGFLADALTSRPATLAGARAAIRDYEDAMPAWAVPAIRESLRPVTVINALANPALRAVAGPALHLAPHVTPARWRRWS